MSYVICIVPVAPIRSDASHRSEQVSQMLFGETAEVLEALKDFYRIKCSYDGYEGFCQTTQLVEITEPINSNIYTLAAGWLNEVTVNNASMQIPFGSSLSFLKKANAFPGNYEVNYHGESWNTEGKAFDEATITMLSKKYLNTSYLWGGRSVFGVDCSGFCQTVFKFMGVKLLRDASQQATQGDVVGFLQEARCGDLAFFDNAEGRITHVGILLNQNTIIHSSGKVRIDTIDNAGIVSSDTGQRTHQLRIIKRVVT